jgi:hypothetical protein
MIGHTASSAGFFPILRLVRHDSASPDATAFVGDVNFSGGTITRLFLSDEAAAVIVGDNVRVVDLSVASLPYDEINGVLANLTDVAVTGHWALLVSGNQLSLAERIDPFTVADFTLTGTPTAILATQGKFLVFTTTGYAVIDPEAPSPTLDEFTDASLGNLRCAFVSGTVAMVAGPASTFDRSRLLRLDLTSLAAPRIVRSHEMPGTFVALAWDGGSTSVVAVRGNGDGPDARTFHQGYVVREGIGGFTDAGVPLEFWSLSTQPLAAHAGRLFAVEARGLLFLRIR